MSEFSASQTAMMTALPGESDPVRLTKSAPKIAQIIAADIKMKIVRREMKVGEFLPAEARLAEIHGVSRPTIREMLRLLEAEGLTSVRRGGRSGSVILAPDIETNAQSVATVLQFQGTSVADVWSAWSSIECTAISTIARSADRIDLSPLRIIVDKTRDAIDSPEAFTNLGLQFSEELIRLAGNETNLVLFRLLRHIVVAEIRAVRRHIDPAKLGWRREGSADFTSKILDMIDRGELDAASLWRIHLDEVAAFFLQIIGPATVVDILGIATH
jgi:DNA-binding FadR family transcriptional regulator